MDLSLQVSRGGPTAVGSVLRTNQAYLELLGEKTSLDWGIAFSAPAFVGWHAGQQFREVTVADSNEAETARGAVAAYFAERNLVCSTWALTEGQDPAAIEPMLRSAGYDRSDQVVLALPAWPASSAPSSARVLPARPMRAAFREVWTEFAQFADDDAQPAIVEAAERRLDDHRMDAFVATAAKDPAGVCALFQVGDIGRILDLYVARAYRRLGIASTLLRHVIEMAQRLMLRVVCVEVGAENAAALALLRRLGFVDAGRAVEFRRRDLPWPEVANAS